MLLYRMRYAIFRIPASRIATRGGWDDFWYWTDDLPDARTLVARDPQARVQQLFPGIELTDPVAVYQIVDLTTGDVIMETGRH